MQTTVFTFSFWYRLPQHLFQDLRWRSCENLLETTAAAAGWKHTQRSSCFFFNKRVLLLDLKNFEPLCLMSDWRDKITNKAHVPSVGTLLCSRFTIRCVHCCLSFKQRRQMKDTPIPASAAPGEVPSEPRHSCPHPTGWTWWSVGHAWTSWGSSHLQKQTDMTTGWKSQNTARTTVADRDIRMVTVADSKLSAKKTLRNNRAKTEWHKMCHLLKTFRGVWKYWWEYWVS